MRRSLSRLTLPTPAQHRNFTLARSRMRTLLFALYHHYLRSTAAGLSWLEETSTSWSEVIPALACRFNFLLHALLAIAATHKSLTEKKGFTSWAQISNDHMRRALTSGRQALGSINQDNAGALFALSIFVDLYYLVDMTHRWSRDTTRRREEFIRFSRLVRQNAFVPISALDDIKRGPLRVLLSIDDSQLPKPAFVATLVERITERVRWSLSTDDLSGGFSCLQDALDKLTACISKAFSRRPKPDFAAVFESIVTVYDNVFRFVELNDERALFLLACWCPLLDVQSSIWVGCGWQADFSREIVDILKEQTPDWETEVTAVQQAIEDASQEITLTKEWYAGP